MNLTDDQQWSILHDYRRLVAQDKVPAIPCPEDGAELYPTMNAKTNEPMFRCFECRATYSIAHHVWETMLNNMVGIEIIN